jgi:hypothetical protein
MNCRAVSRIATPKNYAAYPAFYICYQMRMRGKLRGIHIPSPAPRFARAGFSAEGKRKRDKKKKGENMEIEQIAKQIFDSSLKVHKALGPGLLESAYQACLAYELLKRGMQVDLKVDQPINY